MMAGAGYPAFRIKAKGQADASASLARRRLHIRVQSSPAHRKMGRAFGACTIEGILGA
jgi:hypothetical protein